MTSIMTRRLAILAVCTLALTVGNSLSTEKPKFTGMYSRSATAVFDLYFTGKKSEMRIPSPDKKSSLIVRYKPESTEMVLSLRSGFQSFEWNVGIAVGAEIAWSPDSQAFFLTKSSAGRNGLYETTIYLLEGDQVKLIEVTPVVHKVFGQPVKCDVPEPPNVAGIKWLEDSHRILVAAEIVHHSNCDSNGTFKLYAISVPDLEVVGNYDQLGAKKNFWNDLGWELRPANDECIRHPKSCELTSNHRGEKN
jgi:hypothetical protein